MESYENRVEERDLLSAGSTVATGFLTKVYAKMFFALLITALTAWITASEPGYLNFVFGNGYTFFVLLGAELLLVWVISSMAMKLSLMASTLLFALYSVINGLTLSSIFSLYTASSVASTCVVAALTFGAMALYGMLTRKDLSGLGRVMMMFLIGLIIASVVNLFMHSEKLMWITSYVGVLVFCGLTAYDMQKLKQMGQSLPDNAAAERMSVTGALVLYLDFVNLFLYLLRIMGSRRN